MSVINQMLKDLERRQSNNAHHGVDMFRLLKVGPEFSGHSSFNHGKLLLLVLFGAIMLLLVKNWQAIPANTSVNPTSFADTSKQVAVADKPIQSAPTLIYDDRFVIDAESFEDNAAIENISVKEMDGFFRLEIESFISLYESVEYASLNGDLDQFRINHSFLKTGLPSVDVNNQYVKSIRINQVDDSIVINIMPKENMSLDFSEVMRIEGQGYRLNIEIKPKPVSEVARYKQSVANVTEREAASEPEWKLDIPKETISIKKIPSNKVTAESNYLRGMTLLRSGDLESAISEFEQALRHSPNFVVARTTLVSVYLRLGRFSEAGFELEEGMNLAPYNAEIASMYGRLLIDKGEFDAAISVLKAAEINAKKNAEYLALIAAASQRLSRHDEAVQYYVKALGILPEKSIWWIGMGISLESIKKYKEAAKAYHAAKKNGLLDIELMKYVDARIKHLKAS